jgi:hypothetical protein
MLIEVRAVVQKLFEREQNGTVGLVHTERVVSTLQNPSRKLIDGYTESIERKCKQWETPRASV